MTDSRSEQDNRVSTELESLRSAYADLKHQYQSLEKRYHTLERKYARLSVRHATKSARLAVARSALRNADDIADDLQPIIVQSALELGLEQLAQHSSSAVPG